MTDRPLVKYEDGKFFKDFGGTYYPTDRFNVVMTREMFLTRTDVNAERYVKDCNEALKQYAAMEEAK
tara:strand:+ start:2718 stop:2918 length:201 start_codon:yes stop_codon:yes gene_type:complete